MVDYPVFQLLGMYSGETFLYGPGVYTRMFIAVLFLKTIKLDITQMLINSRKVSGVLIHGVLYSRGNEWATVNMQKRGWI